MPSCGVRGCVGKHEGAPLQVGGYFVLKCDMHTCHRAWNVDQKWFWATRRPPSAQRDAPAPLSAALGGEDKPAAAAESSSQQQCAAAATEVESPQHVPADKEASSPSTSSESSSLIIGRWSDSDRAAAVASYLQRREPEEWTRLLKLAAADAEILSQGSDSHDRFVPRKRRKTQSFVWQHCHLKKSTNGAQWYCNICTGNGSLPPGSWGK